MRRILAVVVASIFMMSTGCSHTVVIDSDPTGAEIRVNGERIGSTPVTYTETTGWEKVYEIEASKPGYKATRKQVKQTEWNIPVTAVSGIGFLFCLLPAIGILWARQMPERVVVNMDKGSNAVDPGMAAPPSSYGY